MRYLFGDCVLDTQRCVLLRAGQPMRLRPKVFHLLVYLLTQRERVVSKQELSEQVWNGQYISDATLESTLTAARRALGGRGRNHRYIQTLHGHGYRFVAPVEEHAEPLGGAADDARCPLEAAPTATPPEDLQTTAAPALPAAVGQWGGAVLLASPESSPCADEPPLDVGERKLVTVLCCALNPGPESHAPADLDTLHQQLHALYDLAQREVHQYEGTLLPLAGNRLLAVFGLPVAHEDHAQRAVLAALGLQQWLHAYREAAAPLVGCLGLHTGSVAIGGLGNRSVAAATVIGDTVEVAIALQAWAAPGAIVCSEPTARLVQGTVRLVAREPVAMDGQSAPLPIYEVHGRRQQQSPRRFLHTRPLSPFVGRTRELAILEALLAQAAAGWGQVVGIVGEPGLGKSRLAYEFRRSLRGRRLTYLAGSCLAYGQHTPYLPVLTLLRTSCGITAADCPAAITTKVRQRLAEVEIVPEACAPYLLRLLDMPTDIDPLAPLSPEVVKVRTVDSLVQLALHGARQRPLVLEIENLHWIDPSSEEVLAALVERLVGASMLVLTTYRPGYRSPWLDKSYASQVVLSRLPSADSRSIVQAVLGSTQIPEPQMQAIVAKADGNPFFLEELARAVGERHATQMPVSVIPETVQAVLAARIDRLPPEEKRLLQTAAVVGAEVSVPLLQAIADLPGEALHRALGHLQAAEFLYETRLFPEPEYTFKHALTHEVAYGGLLQERRRVLHARIVEALEALAGDRVAEQVERLAHHALRGEVWAKAVTYCQQAGARAYARAALREAVAAFEQALQALARLPEDGDTRGRAIELRLALGYALGQLAESGRSLALLGEAEALARALDDRARLGRVLTSMAWVRRQTGDYDGALAAGRQALALAAALGDSALQVDAYFRLGPIYYALGDFGQAAELLRQNVEAADRESDRLSTSFRILSQAWLARTLGALGAFAEGRRHGEEALRLAMLAGRGVPPILAYGFLGCLYLAQGDLEHAIRMLEQGLALCRVSGERAILRSIAASLGSAYALQGRLAEGRVLLEEGISEVIRTGALFDHASLVACLSEVCRLAGHSEEAWQYARQALDLARQLKERGNEALALHQLGVVQAHAAPPDTAQAEAYYQQALALAEELGMRPLVAHCHLGLGRLYTQTGRGEQARAALGTAIDLYHAMDMTFWLPQAKATLEQVA